MKKNTTNTIADTIIEGLKNGTAPWTKPWTPEQCAAPFNPVTGTVYKGVNFVYLSMVGKSDPRWMTYKQAQSQGWQVRSGEHGRSIQFWKFNEENTDPATGQKETVRRERPVLRTYTVFNADQIEGFPELEKKEAEEWQRHERAENILDRSGVPIHHVQGDKAAYRPFSDEIIMPEKRQFATADRYYGTALHELGHATGHESRLNRDIHHPFGSREYAKEELRAEIASYMLGMQLGIGHDPENHLAYIDSWVGILEEKPTEIFKACADAEKIQAYVLEYEKEQEKTQEEETDMWKPEYIVTDECLTCLSKEGRIDAAYPSEEMARFADPEAALTEALRAKEEHKEYLESLSEPDLYIYRTEDSYGHIEQKPVLRTTYPILMRNQWTRNIGGTLPECLKENENRAMPGMPESQVNPLTGRRFISFYSGQEIDDAGNISLQTQEALQRGVTIGVLRFENALEKELDEKARLNLQELSKAGVDGVILTKDGRPVEALTTDENRLFKGIFQAAAGLERKYLCVSYEEKEAVKELGALWDGKAKSWYIPEGLDSKPFAAWEPGRSNTADNPQEKFAEFVREMGGNLKGELPIMDGQIHRIPEVGGKPGNKNISYVGHLDGVPAGWVKNFRGAEGKWKMEGVVLTKEDREKLQKEAAEKQQQRQKERLALYEQKAKESLDYVKGLDLANGQEGYFKEKGIAPPSLTVRKDQAGHIVVPLVDASGKQWSYVTLQKNGFKQILKDSRAQGTFHVIGAENHEQITGPILLCEGYSTGAAINELTGMPVVCCTTSNNLEHVAVALKEKHPEQAFVILGDNDAYLEAEGKINAGQTKARAAAAAVDGSVFFPDFGDDKLDKHRTDFLDMARLMGKEQTRQYIEVQTELAAAKKEVVQEKAQEKEKEEKKEAEKETAAQMER